MKKAKTRAPFSIEVFCGLLILFEYYIRLFLGYFGNRIGMRGTNFSVITLQFIFIVSFIIWIIKRKDTFKVTKLVLFVFFFNIVTLVYSLLLNNDLLSIIAVDEFDILKFVLYLPLVVLTFSSIQKHDDFLYWLVFVARFAWIMPFLTVYLDYSRSGYVFDGYSMDAGYNIIFCTLILLYSFFAKKKYLDLILAVFTFIVVLGIGSRGAILVFLIYLSLLVFQRWVIYQKAFKKILIIFLIVAAIILVNFYLEDVIEFIHGVFERLNINTRTLDYFLEGNMSDDSGRKNIQAKIIESWNEMPVFGYGILSDRLIASGHYSHNIVIEFITDYGFVLGGIFLIVLFTGILRTLFIKDLYKKDLFLIVACFAITQLFISGSYLTTTLFYVTMGLAFSNNPKSALLNSNENTVPNIASC